MLHKKQLGEVGFQTLLLLICVVLIGRALISLVPLYLERSTVVSLLNEAAEDARLADHNKRQLMDNINAKFRSEGIKHPSVAELEIIRELPNYILTANYSAKGSYFANIELVINFDPIGVDVTDLLSSE